MSKTNHSSELGSKHQKKNDFQTEISLIPGETWVDKLKFAFDEVDVKHSGQINLHQWMNSKLCYLISNKPVSQEQMKEIFQNIDFNCDETIEWNELVDFLLTSDSGIDSNDVEKSLKISYLAPSDLVMQRSRRQSANFRIMFLPAQGELVTLSDSAMCFWSPEDCNPIRTFTDKHPFCDFCEVKCLSKICIAKSNRQLIFYDIRTHKKIDFMISASYDGTEILKMTYNESKGAIVGQQIRKIPLFYNPTSIFAHNTQPIIFVGDEEGNIEVFKIITSGSSKLAWSSQRVNQVQFHNDSVTQIGYLSDNDAYLSSSLDGTFVLWRYSNKDNQIQKAYKIQIRDNVQIRSFVYDMRTRDIVFTTSSHYFGVWRTFTTHQELIETRSEVIQTLVIIPFSDDTSFCVAISKNNSISLYRMPSMEIINSHYLGLQHELCPPASAFYLRGNLYLGGAFLSRWTCINNTNEGLSAHKTPIVAAMINDIFGRILSIDQQGDFISWSIDTGRKICVVSLNELNAIVCCATIDDNYRKVAIGYSNGLVKLVSANSGTLLNEIDKNIVKGGCNYILFAKIFNSNRIICCGNKYAVLFEDIPGNRIQFVRKFVGHSEPITRCAVLKNRFLITVGFDQELFLWNIQMQNPVLRYQMPEDPTLALDLPNDPNSFLVGDVYGNIHIMNLDSPTPISTFRGVELSIKSSLTTLFLGVKTPILISGNLHGYIKYWTVEAGNKFVEKGRFRAHEEAILSASFSDNYKVLITAGRDEEIKLWSLEPFGYLGPLGKAERFNIEKQNTWVSTKPLPDNPVHFMDPLETEMAIAERERMNSPVKKIDEERVKTAKDDARDKIEVPAFSIEAISQMYDSVENLCLSGRQYMKMAAARDDDLPLSARPIEPPPLEIDLADNDLLVNTINMYNLARNRPKIWKPKTKA